MATTQITIRLFHKVKAQKLLSTENMLDSFQEFVLTSEKFKGVKPKNESGVLDISAHNPDQESAERELDVTSAAEFDIAFNVNYLKEVWALL